jgi:hypothetical protein
MPHYHREMYQRGMDPCPALVNDLWMDHDLEKAHGQQDEGG